MALQRIETDGIKDSAITAVKIADGTVVAAEIADDAVVADKIATNAVTNVKIASGVDAAKVTTGTLPMARLSGTLPALNGSALTGLSSGPRHNLIINGDMTIAQRGTSFASPANNAYTLDRWRANIAGAGAITVTQDTEVPAGQGFDKSIKLDVTTADTSIGAGDFFGVAYRVEAFDMPPLEAGTANAKAITLSFWVRSPVTGTYYVAFRNSASDRNYCASYTVSSADTWEKKTISITMDTSGTWLSSTNGIGMEIRFSFAAGSTYHGTANTWQAGNLFAASNIANAINSTSNNVFLTGVKLEVGSTATDFEHRSYVEEHKLCQRYCRRYGTGINGRAATTANFYFSAPFEEAMRATPTLTLSDTSVGVGNLYSYDKTSSGSSFYVARSSKTGITGGINGFTGLTAGDQLQVWQALTDDYWLLCDAELQECKMNIKSVTKQFDYNNTLCSYLLIDDDNNEYCVPANDSDNRHYQMIQEWVAEGNTIEE